MTTASGSGADPNRVAVVLSGAAARGAFQAGALAEIIPVLESQGLTPTIWLGTSAGSINATLFAAELHRGASAAAARVLEVWSSMSDDDVYRSLLPFSLARSALQYATGAVLERGPGLTSLLNTAPLQRTAAELLPTAQLAANVRGGVVSAVGVVATRMPADTDAGLCGAASGRSVVFLDEQLPGAYEGDPDRALDVVRTQVAAEHVMASSAIPVGFPPVQISAPEAAAAWYVDGGVRLNAPLHPAVGLGAGKILLVSATSTRYPPPPIPAAPGRIPDSADAAAQVLHAVLADRTTEDLDLLRRTNRLVEQAGSAGRVLTRRSGGELRPIDVMAVCPAPGKLGRIASEVHARRTSGLGFLRETDNWLLGRIIRGAGDAVGRRELLSYLFFDEQYFAAGIELGRRCAASALAGGWQR